MKNLPTKTIPKSGWRAPLLALACSALLGLFGNPAMARDEGQPQTNLRRIDLTAGMYRIDTQLAITPQQREIGLMFPRRCRSRKACSLSSKYPACSASGCATPSCR